MSQRQSHRLVPVQPHDYSEESKEQLRQLLLSYPAVTDADVGERHLKGGYKTWVKMPFDELEAFLVFLRRQGWISVL
jgi:hypothetical protein